MSTFAEFFRLATRSNQEPYGRDPYPFQERFAQGAELCHLVRAPTGSGKTATAVLGWLWRLQSKTAANRPQRSPYVSDRASHAPSPRTCQTAESQDSFGGSAGSDQSLLYTHIQSPFFRPPTAEQALPVRHSTPPGSPGPVKKAEQLRSTHVATRAGGD